MWNTRTSLLMWITLVRRLHARWGIQVRSIERSPDIYCFNRWQVTSLWGLKKHYTKKLGRQAHAGLFTRIRDVTELALRRLADTSRWSRTTDETGRRQRPVCWPTQQTNELISPVASVSNAFCFAQRRDILTAQRQNLNERLSNRMIHAKKDGCILTIIGLERIHPMCIFYCYHLRLKLSMRHR